MDEFSSRHFPVREDMRFQRRSWIVERAGWILLAAIALAGLAGLFGSGPLSTARASGARLTVDYDRFQRATRGSAFVFTTTAGAGGELTLHLNAPFQRDFEFASVQPPPLRSRTGPDGVDLTFATQAGAESHIVIWTQSRHDGLSRLTAAVDGGAAATFWVFVYP